MYNEYVVSHSPPENGDTIHTTCPSCGRDKLYITRAEDGSGILYNCFRGSCNFKGRIAPSGANFPNVTRITPVETGNPYTGTLSSLLSENMDVLNAEAGFQPQHFSIARPMWDLRMARVAFPILSPVGRRRGWVLRSYNGVEPKALTYMDIGETRLSHYGRKSDRTALLVEDIPSAVRASPYLNSVALLGTHLTSDMAAELQSNYDHVIICLDADATRQAIVMREAIDLMFATVCIIVPDKDLKNMQEDELEEFLKNV